MVKMADDLKMYKDSYPYGRFGFSMIAKHTKCIYS